MATTTVRLSQGAKRRLDALQARLVLLGGRSLTKEEVLERLVEHGERFPAHLLDDEAKPPTDSGLRRLLSLPTSTGIRTHPSEIDRVLYGDTS